MRRLFFWLAALNAAVVVWSVYDETATRRPWKALQEQMNRLRERRGEPERPIAIRQLAVPALGVVDRCTTCHQGIAKGGYDQKVPRVLRTHPQRAALLGPHPPERFGCTPCHGGQGPQTKGTGFSPFDHGRDDPYWERPLLSGDLVQATCLDCHEQPPAGAETLARGRFLFESLGCQGCHSSRHLEAPTAAFAPALDHVRDKSSREHLEAWILDPRAIRPGARMPGFWPVPVVPATGRPAPARSTAHGAWLRARGAEPRAMAAYLVSASSPLSLPEVAAETLEDPARVQAGQRLFETVGCRGCHRISAIEDPDERRPSDAVVPSFWPTSSASGDNPGQATMAWVSPLEADFGPSLDAVGEKATARWLRAWLTDPRAVWPDARMPNLRLAGDEIDSLVAFLVSVRRPGRAAAQADAGPAPDAALVAAGRQAILRYGCTGCHEIPGIARAGRPGPDLDAFGDKTSDELSFGDARLACDEPLLACFAEGKLRAPRRFLGGGVQQLLMPDFELTAEEARSLTVFLLANRRRSVAPEYRRPLDTRTRAIAEGERVFSRHNCRGCHEIGRVEGRSTDGTPEWLAAGGDRLRSVVPEPALAPPALTHAGEKFLPTWLWDFLAAPGRIRPQLVARMPTFRLDDGQIGAVAFALAAMDRQPYPVVRATRPAVADRDQAAALFETMQCQACHPADGQAAPIEGPIEALAPDLALAPSRLKAAWIRAWLEDPQVIAPGTRMPAFFSLEGDPPRRMALPGFFGDDASQQIDALVGLVMSGDVGRNAGERRRP